MITRGHRNNPRISPRNTARHVPRLRGVDPRLTRVCPVCDAQPGSSCITLRSRAGLAKGGYLVKMKHVHPERKQTRGGPSTDTDEKKPE